MIIVSACIIAIAVIAYILGVREKDLPQPEPVSPFEHLDERKAAIYENLRDLNFEYKAGKFPEADYQEMKTALETEAAGILAEMEADRARTHFIILGIGINVNWTANDMPPDLRETATSLQAEAGKEFNRAPIASAILEELEKEYALFLREGFSARIRVVEVVDHGGRRSRNVARQFAPTACATGQGGLSPEGQ